MNPEELISKYIDSELTIVEDEELRSLLTENKELKEKFDSSVSLHYAFREDAESIVTPEDVFKETEDKILMKILQSSTVGQIPPYVQAEESVRSGELRVVSDKKTRLLRNEIIHSKLSISNLQFPIGKMSLAVAALLLIFVLRISDNSQSGIMIEELGFGNAENNAESSRQIVSTNMESGANLQASETRIQASEPRKQNTGDATGINEVLAINGFSSDENNVETSHWLVSTSNNDSEPISMDSYMNSGAGTGSEDAIVINEIIPVANDVIVEDNTISSNNETSSDDNNVETSRRLISTTASPNLSSAYSEIQPSDYNMSIALNPFSNLAASSEIQLSTFFGTDFFRGGLDISRDQVVSHFAQSIAYAIDDRNRVGIEIGYTQYAYNDDINVKVPVGKTPGTQSIIEVLEPGDYDYINYNMVVERSKQIFWGAAFYEYTVFDDWNFSVNTRAGVGSSGEGMLGYGRIFGKYKILPGFYATVGIDGRLFYATLQSLGSNSSGTKASASLIYGLQLKF